MWYSSGMALAACVLVWSVAQTDPVPDKVAGIHNLHLAMPGLWSGSGPEGDAGFASLKKLGVKTVISVDGAKPDIERARRYGMRYVHLPIGYAGVPADFPETAKISSLAREMVEIDEHWENLKLANKAAWKTPVDHPDIDPPHEASILSQRYQAAQKGSSAAKELQQWLGDARRHASDLEILLRKRKNTEAVGLELLEQAFGRMAMDCTRCHAKFRDTPSKHLR